MRIPKICILVSQPINGRRFKQTNGNIFLLLFEDLLKVRKTPCTAFQGPLRGVFTKNLDVNSLLFTWILTDFLNRCTMPLVVFQDFYGHISEAHSHGLLTLVHLTRCLSNPQAPEPSLNRKR